MKEVIFSMSPDSALGLDGVSGRFYQQCWDVISADLTNMVCEFFAGSQLSKSFTHTYLIAISKVTCLQSFTEMRPINLSNFSCKIIYKLLNTRLDAVIHKVVSPNQTGFLKDRSITENLMLTQELVRSIKKPNANGNIIMKLDMAKAFFRVN